MKIVPVTPMVDPVLAADGYTYPRSEWESHISYSWFSTTSPTTGKALPSRIARPNHSLKSVMVNHGATIDDVTCPIERDIFTHPVQASDGHTYEQKAIERWLQEHTTSPLTGARLGAVGDQMLLVPNRAISCIVARLQDRPQVQEAPGPTQVTLGLALTRIRRRRAWQIAKCAACCTLGSILGATGAALLSYHGQPALGTFVLFCGMAVMCGYVALIMRMELHAPDAMDM